MKRVIKGAPLSIAANDWNGLVDMRNANAGGVADNAGAVASVGLNAGWVWVKNTSGSNRNRFDCMALGDPVMAIETNAQQDVLFAVTTADPAKAAAILLEPIANGLVGRAVIYGLALATVAAATSTSMLYAVPNASGHNLAAGWGGAIKLLNAPSTSAAKLVPVLLNTHDERAIHFKSGASAIAAGTDTQLQSATVRKYNVSTTGAKTDSGTDIVVWNDAGQFSANTFGVAHPNEKGLLVITVEKCSGG